MNKILHRVGLRWFFAITAVFLLLIVTAILTEQFVLLFAPAFFIVVYLAIFHLDKLLLLVVFFTPLSINIEELGIESYGLYLPTEPILFGLLLVFTVRQFYRNQMDTAFFKHPVTIALIIYMVWMFVTCISSEYPVVSWKYYLARLWFVVPVFFLGVMVLRDEKNIKRMLWAYILPLTLVMIWTLVRHSFHGMTEETGHWVMTPFYKDHTSYGAIIALFFPVVVGFLRLKSHPVPVKVLLIFIFVIFTTALVFSYTRAAWLSLVGALVVYIAMRMQLSLSLLLWGIALSGVVVALNWDQIQISLERNKSEHATEDFAERIESMSNISSDASNLERLNLWASALRMTAERPVLGWGPGSFQFCYGQFQHYDEMTVISEKSGRDVNAHSEYLGPLAESGILGMLSILAVVIAVVATGIRLYFQLPSGELRLILLGVVLGLITYFSHGILNNYMDTDKASVPVWMMAAIVVSIDIRHKKKAVNNALEVLGAEGKN